MLNNGQMVSLENDILVYKNEKAGEKKRNNPHKIKCLINERSNNTMKTVIALSF